MAIPTTILEPTFLAQLDRLALVSRRLRAGQIQGERRSPKRGGSVEFADFRTYATGDDFRQIDWNAYARLERLFVKLYVAEEDLTIHLLLDTSESMAWGEPQKWAFALRLAAALGYVGLVGLDRVTAAALGNGAARGGDVFRPHRGKRQAIAWFEWLAGLQAAGTFDPESAIYSYMARTSHPGPLIVISDLMASGWGQGLRALAGRRYDVTVLHTLAPQEVRPELEGDLRLVDSETRAEVEITADYDLLRRYHERLEAWQADLRQACGAIGAQYVAIETNLPLEELILAYLRKYGVLR